MDVVLGAIAIIAVLLLIPLSLGVYAALAATSFYKEKVKSGSIATKAVFSIGVILGVLLLFLLLFALIFWLMLY